MKRRPQPAAPCLPLLLGWSQPPLHLFAEKELSSPSPPPHRSPRDHSHWEALSLIVIPTNLAAANKSHPLPLPTCLHANPFVGYLNNSGAVISPPLWQPAGREGRRMMTVGNSARLLEAAQTCFMSPFPSPAQRRAGRGQADRQAITWLSRSARASGNCMPWRPSPAQPGLVQFCSVPA